MKEAGMEQTIPGKKFPQDDNRVERASSLNSSTIWSLLFRSLRVRFPIFSRENVRWFMKIMLMFLRLFVEVVDSLLAHTEPIDVHILTDSLCSLIDLFILLSWNSPMICSLLESLWNGSYISRGFCFSSIVYTIQCPHPEFAANFQALHRTLRGLSRNTSVHAPNISINGRHLFADPTMVRHHFSQEPSRWKCTFRLFDAYYVTGLEGWWLNPAFIRLSTHRARRVTLYACIPCGILLFPSQHLILPYLTSIPVFLRDL